MCLAFRRFFPSAILIMGMSLLAATGRAGEESPSPQRFSKQIEAFARQDLDSPPKAGVTVFVGSSSIRRWDLAKSFGNLDVINRGFGGSQISDVLHYANEVVLKYKPKKVVFFCGGNDLNYGKTPRKVASDFETFTKLLFKRLPETELIVLALTAAIALIVLAGVVFQHNALRVHEPLSVPLVGLGEEEEASDQGVAVLTRVSGLQGEQTADWAVRRRLSTGSQIRVADWTGGAQ